MVETAQTTAKPTAAEDQQKLLQTPVHEEVHQEAHNAPLRTICIAVDGSKHSSHAVDWALANIVKPESDQIVLLNCRPYVSLPALSYGAPFIDYGGKPRAEIGDC